jgi:hypothetical protein
MATKRIFRFFRNRDSYYEINARGKNQAETLQNPENLGKTMVNLEKQFPI